MGYGNYLIRVQTTWHFRFTLPPLSIGNSRPLQIKRSLALHDTKTAKKLSSYLAGQLELFMTTSNLGLVGMDQDERKRVLFAYLDQQINDWKSVHAHGPRLTKEEHQERLQEARAQRQDCLWNIQSSNLKPSLEKVKTLYQQLGIDQEANKDDAYGLAKIEALFYQFVELTLSGDLDKAEKLLERQKPIEASTQVQQSVPAQPDAPLISVLIEEYLVENKKSWASRTLTNYTSDLRVFLRLIEDVPINKFTKDDFNQFREKLKILPKHNKKGNEPIKAQRANNIITNVSSFFNWCEKERDVIDKNFAQGRTLPKPRNEESRERFTKKDLELIFNSKEFKTPNPNKMYNYWVPIIGYYSEMRLAEICLLRKEDIYQTKEGIWAISLNEKYRTLKNKTSIREIPIHNDIISLGFIDYINNCKHDCIFKTTSKEGRHDDAIGKSFSRFKKSLGFGPNKVFHCFRNTFIDEVYQQGLDKNLYKDFVGHSQDDITHGIYASKASVKRLKEDLLDKMTFPISLPSIFKY
jgi:integrase